MKDVDHVDSSKTFAFRATNRHEVKSVLEQVKLNKANGHNSIPPRALKASAPTIDKPLSDLINIIIAKSEVPQTWKRGEIAPLHKKDSLLEKKLQAYYRPSRVF